jgi:hypothetical protein
MTTLEGQTLARTIILALERMAFVLAEEVAEELATELGPYQHHAMIGFRGQGQDVKLFLAASDGFLLEFTANLLGLDETEFDMAQYGPQAISELASLVGDEVIVMMGGTESDYALDAPILLDDEELETMLVEEERPLTCYLESEGEVLRAQILMKEVQAS